MPSIHQGQRAARKRLHERVEQVQPEPARSEPRDLLAPLRAAALDLNDDREQLGQRGTGARWSRGSSRREQQVTAIEPMDLNIAATAPSQIDKDALGSLRRCQNQEVFVSGDTREDFTRPTCQTRYRIIRARAEPGKTYRAIHCRVCRAVLAPTDGDDILKYFITHRTTKTRT
jgi:hypothetical protein